MLMIAMGILFFFLGGVSANFTNITVSSYVVFFGLLLSCLECNISACACVARRVRTAPRRRLAPPASRRPPPAVAPKFQRNFGFMYSFSGRSLFIVFAGSMVYAMNNWLAWIVGSLTMLNGIFNGYIICVHPAFKTGELSAKGDPYGGYSGGEAEMLDFLKRNPQLAQKAGQSAAAFAAENPDVAQAAVSGAAGQGGFNPFGGARK